MISGFLTSVISSSDHASISRNARWLLISPPSSTPAFLAAKRLISEPIKVSTDVADKHARYISEITGNSGEVEKVTNELGDNGAHRCVDYCFVNAPPLYLREGTPLQTQVAPMPCSFAARMAANRSLFFTTSSCLAHTMKLLYLIRNKVDYW